MENKPHWIEQLKYLLRCCLPIIIVALLFYGRQSDAFLLIASLIVFALHDITALLNKLVEAIESFDNEDDDDETEKEKI